MFNVKQLDPRAVPMTRSNPDDAGLDLATIEAATIPPGHRALLRTGWAVEIPSGSGGFIKPRSKLANRYGIDVLAGVVDAGYRGEVMVSIINHGLDSVEFKAGDKIAQLVIQPVNLLQPVIVDELVDTGRGSRGINDSELRLR